ncbi:MAG: hypothetical protein IJM88_04370 [Bacteroidales bacterium]|nr:hypothetical protein [Bacteroidales bacterium]
MKRILYVLCLVPLVCVGCRSDAGPIESAAMELYHQYANNRQGIAVAYIGDYKAYNRVFNAVMFRANDSIQWQWLKQEFGVIEPGDIKPGIDAKNGVTMLSIHIDTNIKFKSEKEQQAYIDSVVRQVVNETIGKNDKEDSSIFVGTISTDDTNLSTELQSQVTQHKQFDKKRESGGNAEYIISVDLDNKTLICFFCSTAEESKLLVRWLNSNN